MYCLYCGGQMSSGVCNDCDKDENGNKISDKKEARRRYVKLHPQVKHKSVSCTYCGARIKEDLDRCPYCSEWFIEHKEPKDIPPIWDAIKELVPDLSGVNWFKVVGRILLFVLKVFLTILIVCAIGVGIIMVSTTGFLISLCFKLSKLRSAMWRMFFEIPDFIAGGINFISDI